MRLFYPQRLFLFSKLGGRFGYFLFFLVGAGEGGVRGAGRRRVTIFLKIPGGGGVSRAGRGGGGEGPGVCGEFFGGGGLNIFLSGPKFPSSKVIFQKCSKNTL